MITPYTRNPSRYDESFSLSLNTAIEKSSFKDELFSYVSYVTRHVFSTLNSYFFWVFSFLIFSFFPSFIYPFIKSRSFSIRSASTYPGFCFLFLIFVFFFLLIHSLFTNFIPLKLYILMKDTFINNLLFRISSKRIASLTC